MRVLTKKDVQAVYSMKDAIADDKIALAAYSKGDATVPLRTNIDIKPCLLYTSPSPRDA